MPFAEILSPGIDMETIATTRIARFIEQLAYASSRVERVEGRALQILQREASGIVEEGYDPASARLALERLLTTSDPTPGLHALFDTTLGRSLLPEVAALDLEQGGKRLHKDNLRHSIIVCGQAPARLRVRWAALLHDVGKAPTRRIEGGKVTFYHHEAVGERLAVSLLSRLGYEPGFTGEVGALVAISGRTHGFDGEWTDSAVRRFVAEVGELLEDALDLSRADCTSGRPGRRAQVLSQVDAVSARVERVRAGDAKARIRPALDGGEIMEILSLSPGPAVGRAYRYLLEQAHSGAELTRDEAVTALREFWATR